MKPKKAISAKQPLGAAAAAVSNMASENNERKRRWRQRSVTASGSKQYRAGGQKKTKASTEPRVVRCAKQTSRVNVFSISVMASIWRGEAGEKSRAAPGAGA